MQTPKKNTEQLSRNKQLEFEYQTHSNAKRYGDQIWNGWDFGWLRFQRVCRSFHCHSTFSIVQTFKNLKFLLTKWQSFCSGFECYWKSKDIQPFEYWMHSVFNSLVTAFLSLFSFVTLLCPVWLCHKFTNTPSFCDFNVFYECSYIS